MRHSLACQDFDSFPHRRRTQRSVSLKLRQHRAEWNLRDEFLSRPVKFHSNRGDGRKIQKRGENYSDKSSTGESGEEVPVAKYNDTPWDAPSAGRYINWALHSYQDELDELEIVTIHTKERPRS